VCWICPPPRCTSLLPSPSNYHVQHLLLILFIILISQIIMYNTCGKYCYHDHQHMTFVFITIIAIDIICSSIILFIIKHNIIFIPAEWSRDFTHAERHLRTRLCPTVAAVELPSAIPSIHFSMWHDRMIGRAVSSTYTHTHTHTHTQYIYINIIYIMYNISNTAHTPRSRSHLCTKCGSRR
jgi:hypothetical protein